jgi:hypothetical protein
VEERVRKHKAAVDSVKRDIADTVPRPDGKAPPLDLGRAKVACGALEARIGPALAAMVDSVPEDCREVFRGCVLELQNVSMALASTFLEHAAQGPPAATQQPKQPQPQRFRMADGADSDGLPSLSGEDTVPEPADCIGPSDMGDASKRVAAPLEEDSAQAPPARRPRRFQGSASTAAAATPPAADPPLPADGCMVDSPETTAAAAEAATHRVVDENANERARALAQHHMDQQHAIAERRRVDDMAAAILAQARDRGVRVPEDFSSFSEGQLQEFSRAFQL